MNRVCAIVPAFNEEPTIGSVIRGLTSSPLINEVIVVSDGSTDGTVEIARAAGAAVYQQMQGGKGKALLHGLAQTNAEVILFCDADLRGLTVDHVARLLEPVLNGSRMMHVGLRDRGWIINRLLPFLPLLGGERALRRRVIEAIPPQYLAGYMIESALNYYCRSRHMPYGSVLLPGLSMRRKYEKVGWPQALKQYRKMIGQVVKAMIVVRWAHLLRKF